MLVELSFIKMIVCFVATTYSGKARDALSTTLAPHSRMVGVATDLGSIVCIHGTPSTREELLHAVCLSHV